MKSMKYYYPACKELNDSFPSATNNQINIRRDQLKNARRDSGGSIVSMSKPLCPLLSCSSTYREQSDITEIVDWDVNKQHK